MAKPYIPLQLTPYPAPRVRDYNQGVRGIESKRVSIHLLGPLSVATQAGSGRSPSPAANAAPRGARAEGIARSAAVGTAGRSTPGPKTQALLAYLAGRPQAHRRQKLCELFCANADDPAGALRWHLSRVRRWLGSPVLLVEDERVRFNLDAAHVDSIAFEHTLGTNVREQSADALVAAVDSYQGEFLAGMSLPDAPEFELWLLAERARLHALYERGLNELIPRLIAAARFEDAIARAQQLVQGNPLLEQAHAYLIWLYARTGRRQAALQQYDICRECLRRELAVEPTAELVALRDAVLAGQVGHTVTPAVAGERDWRQSADFVGRDDELAQLQSAWRAARTGRGSVVLVEAEAGGGKTRLVLEFIRRIAPDMGSALTGQCYESTRALPYHPWIEVLETRLVRWGDEALTGLAPFWRDQLIRLLPALNVRLARNAGVSPPTAGLEVEHLFSAAYEFLFNASAGPQLIFIDDLQWADEASLRMFHFLARRSASAPALLIGAFRPEEVHDLHALPALLGDLRRGGAMDLRLTPLALDAVSALTARLWDRLPEGYRPHVSALLMHATGGNPLFVTEILRELAHTSEMPRDVPVPASVRDLIQHRLATLPESARQVIEAIAVVDMPATVAQAQQMSARSEEETIAAIDFGLRSGMLCPQSESLLARYGFTHDLLRDAVVSQLSDVRSRLLQRRAAGMLAQQAGRIAPERRSELAGRIARHAAAGGDSRLVLAWAPFAAEHATRLGAYTDALAGFEAASEALARLRETGTATGDTERQELELLLNRVEVLYRLSRRADEGVLLQQAAAMLARTPDARLEAQYHLREAAYLSSVNAYERAYASAQRAYAQYVQLADSLHAAEALHVASDAKLSRGDPRGALRLQEQSLERYQAGGDVRSAGRLLAEMGWALLDVGEVDRALAHLTQAAQIAEQQDDIFGRAFSALVMAIAWNYYHHAERVGVCAQQAQHLFQAIGNDAVAARALLFLASSDLAAGKLSQARAKFQQTHDEAHARGDGWCEGWAAQMLGRMALHDGDVPEAERWLAHAYHLRRDHEEEQNTVSDLAWMGRLRLAQGRPAQGLDYTREGVERLRAIQVQSHVWEQPDVLLAHAEALSACGREDEAVPAIQLAYAELMAMADKIGDQQIRSGFLDYLVSARIIAAWQCGRTTQYPDM